MRRATIAFFVLIAGLVAALSSTTPTTRASVTPTTTTTTKPTTTTAPRTSTTIPTPPAVQSPSGVPLRLGSNIADYVRLAGDQTVVVPNGTYRAESVIAPHPVTSGPLKGWLVLVAETRHGVVIDLTGSALRLKARTSRVMFVGFKFINGSIWVRGQDITFWHTDHTFPANVWVAQAPDPNNPDAGYYRAPRTVYLDGSAQRVRFAGSDVHDTGTAFVVSGSTDTTLEGVHTWNLSDMGLDPNDVVHSDAIGAARGPTLRLTVRDSWIQGKVMLQDAGKVCPNMTNAECASVQASDGGGPHQNFLFERSWFSHGTSSGFIFSQTKATDPRGIFGTRRDLYSWGHNSGWDRLDIFNGTIVYTPNTKPTLINVTDTNIIKQAPPAGATSPANTWRISLPYDNWR